MTKKRILIGGIVAVLIFIALYAWHELNRTVEALNNVHPDYSVSATALINEFESNEANANKKYQNKILSVQGMIKKVEGTDTSAVVVLGDTTGMSAVRCLLNTPVESSLKAGTMITIKGAITGFNKDETGLLGSDVQLNRCVIAN